MFITKSDFGCGAYNYWKLLRGKSVLGIKALAGLINNILFTAKSVDIKQVQCNQLIQYMYPV